MITSDRRLVAGRPLRTGSAAAYRGIEEIAGEPHSVRTELVGGGSPPDIVTPGSAIACIAHITDLHVADVESPARFEFINAETADARFRELLPMQRPQEALNVHAIESMVRTLNEIDATPVTRSPLDMAVMTGDAIDNAQRNELSNALALLDGGEVKVDSGSPGYEGVQSPAWPGDIYWKPDGLAGGDIFQSAFGFPRRPGVLDAAMAPFAGSGLHMPWLGCYGNHEELCQGVGRVTAALAAAMPGAWKAVALPDGFDRDTALETFVRCPEAFMSGQVHEVGPDRIRQPMSRHDFLRAHAGSGGHGFRQSDGEPKLYYVFDTPAVRFITLDTVCRAGGADGCIDAPQLHWLERRLEEVHSRFRSRDGSIVRTRSSDRIVAVLSHHGFDSLANPRAEPLRDQLMELLLRFDNVVLWLNGHIHANRIAARFDAHSRRGFWEVTTSSIVDWPCQARLVELFDAGHGTLGIGCTMVDHDGGGLAALHRELAANVPLNGFDAGRAGTPLDRNVILLLPSPV